MQRKVLCHLTNYIYVKLTIVTVFSVIFTPWTNAGMLEQDGILLQNEGEVRTIDGIWSVLVVIHPATVPDLTKWYETIMSIVNNNQTTKGMHNDDIYMWRNRIKRLYWSRYFHALDDENYINASSVHHRVNLYSNEVSSNTASRKRRGLFNAGGWLANKLFGVAQQSDIDSIKSFLKSQVNNQNKLYHNQDKMLSVFNQSKHMVERLSAGVDALSQSMGNIQIVLNQALDMQNNITLAISQLQMQRYIDNNILKMEEMVIDFNIRWQFWHAQKLQLERGFLTDDILPLSQLNAVLDQIRDKHLGTLNAEWYYRFLKVQPLILERHQLVYAVEIPGISLTSYTHFSFNYYPTPLSNDMFKIMEGDDNVVISSATNVHFNVHNSQCIGSDPMVCKPLQFLTSPSCETDLLSGTINDDCTFKMKRNKNNSTLHIYRLGRDENNFILVGLQNVSVFVRCKNQRAILKYIYGPTKFFLPSQCTLDATGWRVKSLRVIHTNASVVERRFVELPQLNLKWPKVLKPIVYKKLDFAPLSEFTFKWSELPQLEELDYDSIFDKLDYTNPLFLGLSCTFTLFMIIIIILIVLCKKHIISWPKFPKRKPKTFIPTTVEMQDMKGQSSDAIKMYPSINFAKTNDVNTPFIQSNAISAVGESKI